MSSFERGIMLCITCFTVMGFAACATTTVVREAQPLPLPIGSPQNSCEAGDFVELVPASGFATSSQETGGGFGWTRIDTREERLKGLGIFRGREAVDLQTFLPTLGEPHLTDLHLNRLEPIQDKIETRWTWIYVTLATESAAVALATAMVVKAASDDGSADPSLLGASLGVALLGLVPALISLTYQPSNQENTYYELRKRLLVDGEDDFDAAYRGVNRYNERVRVKCAP